MSYRRDTTRPITPFPFYQKHPTMHHFDKNETNAHEFPKTNAQTIHRHKSPVPCGEPAQKIPCLTSLKGKSRKPRRTAQAAQTCEVRHRQVLQPILGKSPTHTTHHKHDDA